MISQRINAYDIVNVQEDFAYHADLVKHDEHRYRTPPSVPSWVPVPGVPFSDGLNTLPDFKLKKLDRVAWDRCTNADCLTPKGFTYLRLELPGGASLDLYNAHMNAGSGTEKMLRVRRHNVRQLSDYIRKHSAGRAVIVTGDTNSRYTRSGDIVRELRDDNGLTDAWVRLVKGGTTPEVDDDAPTCKESTECELLDKVFYRSGPGLALDAVHYSNEYAEFLERGSRCPITILRPSPSPSPSTTTGTVLLRRPRMRPCAVVDDGDGCRDRPRPMTEDSGTAGRTRRNRPRLRARRRSRRTGASGGLATLHCGAAAGRSGFSFDEHNRRAVLADDRPVRCRLPPPPLKLHAEAPSPQRCADSEFDDVGPEVLVAPRLRGEDIRGVKESGVGREGVRYAMDTATRTSESWS
ncbi:hypothetical protein ACH44C_06770 [Streptomyces purpureus]|uniref:hypothetical protein n=1 Tax=Streptomyces purpureus TaxID=1951 RepID=UPI00378E15CB